VFHLGRVFMAGTEAGVPGGPWSGSTAPSPSSRGAPRWGVPLSQQIRECEKRWSTDCLKVATGEVDPNAVSLVGISGRPRNAMLLYADMCQMGYGVQKDEEAARLWWSRAAEEGNRVAAQRLKTGIYDSLLRKGAFQALVVYALSPPPQYKPCLVHLQLCANVQIFCCGSGR
jgi:hypothetical protein